ncbi:MULTISPECIES: shikimate dehydrogenase family protein [Saccharothrix]|uniref:shikimate dehydrogenase family protein n=1 Tax=Saccharothrix TaxID=2071 RepID=UPI00093F4E63|nr:NAD(P)-binding domain-containing protein [Saccharothrix sp. CB00851]OKI17538.1 shikimate dehydrogenase [Saccharothrix sp. CB00851]
MTSAVGTTDAGRISGTTRLFGVLGDPVVQVRAPGLLNAEFARLGVDAVLVPVHVPPNGLTALLDGLRHVRNLDGLLVTVPHKIAVRELADRVGPAAEASGSANALRREPDGTWYAENFDGTGFVAGLRHQGRAPSGRRVVVVGAGGAGSAIAVALLDAGVAELRVVDRDPERVADLARRLGDRVITATEPDLTGADVVVNATPLGLRADDELPFTLDRLGADAVVADIIMKPEETRLLARAAELGHPVHHGIHMLTHQVASYLDFFGISRA